MNQPPTSPAPFAASTATTQLPNEWGSRHPYLTFGVPFFVFMLGGALEPTGGAPTLPGFDFGEASYPTVYTLKIAATLVAMALAWPGYKQFPCRVSWLAIGVGVVGVVLWVGICNLQLEKGLLAPMKLGEFADVGARSGFNPWERWPDAPWSAFAFLVVRLIGLALVVPIIEEFFLRGLAMRFVIEERWWEVPFGTLTPAAVGVGTLLPVMMHPAEVIAATVWFSMVTWLMYKTRNIWDCIAAHAVTNLLLGVYVLTTGAWQFW